LDDPKVLVLDEPTSGLDPHLAQCLPAALDHRQFRLAIAEPSPSGNNHLARAPNYARFQAIKFARIAGISRS
jgi:ABC-type phosphate transport system ATPase subunit